ncbi:MULTISPECIES: hypothetical protein [unclassified Pseudoalteromonas]|uniref:COG3014 family protein n=1 Tax=unclassified Pseudoalteromonas TaxID=194690 RepID=UPI001FB3C534|nr:MULTISPECIES: hypothetical protein [unclassified Pseudoalteromonas]UOB72291.1 hypothetical protein MTP24_08975 [Pseudoalteromonas sp. APM04]
MKKIAIASLTTLLLSGCATTDGQSPLSSLTNSLTPDSKISKFDVVLASGNLVEAKEIALDQADYDEEDNALDDQFWGMQTASIYRFEKNYEASNKYFDLIEDVMYLEDTEGMVTNVSETLTSSLTNDTFLDYEQSVYDSIMVNTYKALNFTAMGDLQNARVEWNRSDDRQRRAADYFAGRINEKREKQEEEAKKELEEKEVASDAEVNESLSKADELLAEQNIDMSQWTAYDGYVNPFSTFMHGLFFMLNAQDSSDVNKAVDSFKRVSNMIDTNVATDTLALAQNISSGNTSLDSVTNIWVIFENGEMAKKEEFRIDLPVFIVSENVNYAGVALPKIQEQMDQFSYVSVNGQMSEVIADMDRIIKAEFKEEWPLILAREITRSVVKTVVQKQVNDKNIWLGMATGVLQAVTTQADTRTWSVLPKNFQALMLENDGSGQVTINSPGFSQALSVSVDPAKKNIIYVKAINSTLAPSVEVISI